KTLLRQFALCLSNLSGCFRFSYSPDLSAQPLVILIHPALEIRMSRAGRLKLVGAYRALPLFLLSRLQQPDSRVISPSGLAAEKTPLRQFALCLSNLNGCFRFSFILQLFL